MWDGRDFGGAKIALIHNGSLVAYLRDDKPTIPYPNSWDLPGGGREDGESPIDCALRETEEEFGIRLPRERLMWEKFYPSVQSGRPGGYFLAARILRDEIDSIRFGDEGQVWKMMPIREFLMKSGVAPGLIARLEDCLAALGLHHIEDRRS